MHIFHKDLLRFLPRVFFFLCDVDKGDDGGGGKYNLST